MQNKINILAIGDVVGKPGRNALKKHLFNLKKNLDLDFIVANIENASGGFGPSLSTMEELLELPINVFTTGSHIWDKKEFVASLDLYPMVLRPANYPEGNPGKGFIVQEIKGIKIAVLQLQGRTFMESLDCPFQKFLSLKKEFPPDSLKIIDFHGEATSEKNAFAHFVDGEVNLVFGTHTHIPTRDERILNKGTVFITDIGMTGNYDSAIGFDKDIIISRFLKQTPVKFEVAKGEGHLSALFVSFSTTDFKPLELKFIFEPPLRNN